MSNFKSGTTYMTVKFIFAGGLRHGISTELKLYEFAIKADGVALMPTNYDYEDDEWVDRSAISPATVCVHALGLQFK